MSHIRACMDKSTSLIRVLLKILKSHIMISSYARFGPVSTPISHRLPVSPLGSWRVSRDAIPSVKGPWCSRLPRYLRRRVQPLACWQAPRGVSVWMPIPSPTMTGSRRIVCPVAQPSVCDPPHARGPAVYADGSEQGDRAVGPLSLHTCGRARSTRCPCSGWRPPGPLLSRAARYFSQEGPQ